MDRFEDEFAFIGSIWYHYKHNYCSFLPNGRRTRQAREHDGRVDVVVQLVVLSLQPQVEDGLVQAGE